MNFGIVIPKVSVSFGIRLFFLIFASINNTYANDRTRVT